jgi:hypothetical protein
MRCWECLPFRCCIRASTSARGSHRPERRASCGGVPLALPGASPCLVRRLALAQGVQTHTSYRAACPLTLRRMAASRTTNNTEICREDAMLTYRRRHPGQAGPGPVRPPVRSPSVSPPAKRRHQDVLRRGMPVRHGGDTGPRKHSRTACNDRQLEFAQEIRVWPTPNRTPSGTASRPPTSWGRCCVSTTPRVCGHLQRTVLPRRPRHARSHYVRDQLS